MKPGQPPPPPYTLLASLYLAIGVGISWWLTPWFVHRHPSLNVALEALIIGLLWPVFVLMKLWSFLLFPTLHR